MSDRTRPLHANEWKAPKFDVEDHATHISHIDAIHKINTRVNLLSIGAAIAIALVGWGGSWVYTISTQVSILKTKQDSTQVMHDQTVQEWQREENQNYSAIQAQLNQIEAQVTETNHRLDALHDGRPG